MWNSAPVFRILQVQKEADTTVAVLGASRKKERYSDMAVRMLAEHNHRVIPVHPIHQEIEGIPAAAGLHDIAEKVHTLTLYAGSRRLTDLTDRIIRLNPRRVIFNPGTENPDVQKALDRAGIPWIEACTPVLLSTGRFGRARQDSK
jgi:predicted CoA-binding protein